MIKARALTCTRFTAVISPGLLGLYLLDTACRAPSWSDAIITVIHKERKEPVRLSWYGTISLLDGIRDIEKALVR